MAMGWAPTQAAVMGHAQLLLVITHYLAAAMLCFVGAGLVLISLPGTPAGSRTGCTTVLY